MKYQSVVFDIGNVLFYFDHKKICEMMSECSQLSAEQIFEVIFKHGLSREFECGRIDENELWESLKKQCELSCSKEYITENWADIFSENHDVLDLLPTIRENTEKLIICSNTNELHFNFLLKKWPEIFEQFDAFCLSHEIGHMKPDHEIFEAVKKVSVGKTAYFDDIELYANTACKYDIDGYTYTANIDILNVLGIYI